MNQKTMMTKSKTTIHLSDQAKVNIETIRAHVGDITQNAAIETALAYYAAFLSQADQKQAAKTPAKKASRS